MTHIVTAWSGVPAVPGVYAMFGGELPRTWVAYVGIAGNMQSRLIQHFVRRDSSVVTGASAVGLNIDLVSHVDWWEHPDLADSDHRHAAEMVAFEVLDPALRSRGNPRRTAVAIAHEATFRTTMQALFANRPSGRFKPPKLWEAAAQVRSLELRVGELEDRVRRLEQRN